LETLTIILPKVYDAGLVFFGVGNIKRR